MDYRAILDNRYSWQEQTVEYLKKNLKNKPLYLTGLGTKKNAQKLAVIYGFPQIGKTTLILNMMGIKQSCFTEVYDTLRAGVPKGNSSTSTAIIYRRSEKQQFGIGYRSFEGLTENIQYFDKNTFIEELRKIRTQVENQTQRADVLHILLPAKYFSSSDSGADIDVLDTPGVDSRNYKEEAHLKKIMERFLLASDMIIIACNANEIQSLENKMNYLPENWYKFPAEYMIVTTHSYSQDSVLHSYFDIPKAERNINFYDFIKNKFNAELEKVIGKEYPVEIFPIDTGESLQKLLKKCTPADALELQNTSEQIIQELKNAVHLKKTNSLETIIQKLRESVKVYTEEQLVYFSQEEEEISLNLTNSEAQLEKKRNYAQQLQEQYHSLLKKYAEIETYRNFANTLPPKNISYTLPEHYLQISRYSRKGESYFADPRDKKAFLYEFSSVLFKYTEQYLELFKKLIQNTNSMKKLTRDELKKYHDYYFELINNNLNFETLLYPQNKASKLAKEQRKAGLYRPHDRRVYRGELYSLISKFISEYKIQINNCIFYFVQNAVGTELSKLDISLRQTNQIHKKTEQSLRSLEQSIHQQNNRLKEIIQKKETMRTQFQQDMNLLNDFILVAENSYLCHRTIYLKALNNPQTTPDEKIMYLLLLGIIERDYLKIKNKVVIT